jgi:hypothetical protein
VLRVGLHLGDNHLIEQRFRGIVETDEAVEASVLS